MPKAKKATADPDKRGSMGKHGGNRGGDQKQDRKPPKQSRQAAGQDPHRGKEG
jgi:hypothetical protein